MAAGQYPFQSDAVNQSALKSLPCPPASTQEFSDEEDDGPNSSSQLTLDRVDTELAPAKEDSGIKLAVRFQQMNFKCPIRAKIWKALYVRMEALAGSTTDPFNAASLVEATGMLYKDTIQTCFGTQDLLAEEIGLPSFVEHQLTNNYYLSQHGKLTLARILTCFAYNQPDIQYCPTLYPIASILRHFLSEEDTYGLLSVMSSSKRSKYLYMSKNEVEVASRGALELSKKFARKHLTYLEGCAATSEEILNLFSKWLWWIFDDLPFPHVVRIIVCYLVELPEVETPMETGATICMTDLDEAA